MPKKIRILIFIDWFLPAYKAGGPIRSIANLVDNLHADFDFYIVTGDRDLGDKHTFKEIVLNSWVDRMNYKVIYLTPKFQKVNKFKSLFNELEPDIVYFNSLFSYCFTLKPYWYLRNKNVKFLLAPRGMLGSESLKIKSFKKNIFLRLTKLTSFFKNIQWHASSNIELEEIKKFYGKSSMVEVLPNLPVLSAHSVSLKESDNNEPLNLLFIGRIVPIKNVVFLLKVLKKIEFNVELNLIGPLEDEVYWNQCKNLIDDLPENCRVNYLNERDPETIKSYIIKSDLFISTSLNENYGHSIVEALSKGCPVLISDQTPWKHLEKFNAGAVLPLNLELFKEKLNYFNNLSIEEWNDYRIGSLEFFKKNIDLDVFKEQYCKMFNSLAQNMIK